MRRLAPQQADLREQLKLEYRGNRADPTSRVLTVSMRRAQAMAKRPPTMKACSRTHPNCTRVACTSR